MPTYSYIAKSLEGKEKTGTLEAKNTRHLAKILRDNGFILIKAEREKQKRGKLEFSIPFLGRVSLKDKLFFTRNLQVMIGAGFPLDRAIRTLAEQTKNEKFKKTLFEITEEITKGESFSNSLSRHPDIFSELFQNMVKVGEESGTLEEVLEVLARQMEKEHELKSKIQGAMVYPAVIICAMIGIAVLMLTVVVPKLSETFAELKIELPLTTRVIIRIGSFLSERWYLVICLFVFLFFLFSRASKTETGKKIIDRISLKMPIIGPIIKKTNSAYTLRNLSSLITSGVPLTRALEIVTGTLGNIYYRRVLLEAAEKVKKGEKLSQVLKNHLDIYPLTVVQMVAVGEETGETSTILAKLADFFEDEVSRATKNLASVIEPVIMLLIGGAVGFFAISMIQPIYSMISAMQ